MSATSNVPPPQPGRDVWVFRWACLLVAVAALAVFGWMLNDMRLEVKQLAPKVEKLTDRTDALVEKVDRQLPRIATQTEQITGQLDSHLPSLLKRSDALLAHSEAALGSLADVTESLDQYKGLMSVVHPDMQNKELLSYGTSVLNFVGKQNASIGVKTPGSKQPLRQAMPAKQWASTAQRDVQFLSLVGKTKSDVLRGLVRARSATPLHIQLGDQLPLLLGDWLRTAHEDSKGIE